MMAQVRPTLTLERIALGVSIAATLLAPALTYAVTQAVMQQSITELRNLSEDHEFRLRKIEDQQTKLLVVLERVDTTLKFMRGSERATSP